MNVQIRKVGIDLTTADDATELETQVQCHLSGRVYDFRLEMGDNGLILRGRAHTYYAKQLAQQAVMEATRLPILTNEIEVS